MWSCATCSRWICFSRKVGLDDAQRSLSTLTILWFYDFTCSVNGQSNKTVYWSSLHLICHWVHCLCKSGKQIQHTFKTTQRLRLEGNSGGHPVQPHCSSRATYSQFPRTMTRQLLSISKDGDSTSSLGNLCQCLVTLIMKSCFLMSEGSSCVSGGVNCFLSCYWEPRKRGWLCPFCSFLSVIYFDKILSEPSFP